MRDDEFEWDDTKAARNFRDHGVTFDAAREVFQDPFALDWLDGREDCAEARYATVGDRILYDAHAMRGDRIRIISARGAERHEQRTYHEEVE